MDHIIDAREYDLPLHVRVSIDKQVHSMTTKLVLCYGNQQFLPFWQQHIFLNSLKKLKKNLKVSDFGKLKNLVRRKCVQRNPGLQTMY